MSVVRVRETKHKKIKNICKKNNAIKSCAAVCELRKFNQTTQKINKHLLTRNFFRKSTIFRNSLPDNSKHSL